ARSSSRIVLSRWVRCDDAPSSRRLPRLRSRPPVTDPVGAERASARHGPDRNIANHLMFMSAAPGSTRTAVPVRVLPCFDRATLEVKTGVQPGTHRLYRGVPAQAFQLPGERRRDIAQGDDPSDVAAREPPAIWRE